MERKYREITLKRRNRKIKLMAGSLVFGAAVLLGRSLPQVFLEELCIAGTNYMQPAIIKFQEADAEREQAPFLIQFAAPSVFAYTWEEDTPELSVIRIERTKNEEIDVEIPDQTALALLQENLYIRQNTSAAYNEVPNPFENKEDMLLVTESREALQKIDTAAYTDSTALIKDFYVVDASTTADTQLLAIDRLTSYDCTINKEDPGPQILIYHSHSQESFADSVDGEVSTTIVGAGEKLSELLRGYGYDVLHHTGTYDLPDRDNAYSRALPAIEEVLAQNPTIQVVIDLHRDAVAEGTKLVKTIDGKDYARFMFFNGLCRSTSGPIAYLDNPYLQENLAFSFQSQVIAESYFPGITRKIYLKAWRYNMHLRPKNMLIELGAQTNTVEEIMNTTEILAFVIDKVLSGQ